MNNRTKRIEAFTPWAGVFVFFVTFLLFMSTVVPTVITFVDEQRFQNDLVVANTLNAAFQASANSDKTYEAYEIREMLKDVNDHRDGFATQAIDTGIFYLPEEHRIEALRFEDALRYGRRHESWVFEGAIASQDITFTDPSKLFGDGAILLSRDGSTIARHVDYMHEHARRYLAVNPYVESSFIRFIDQLEIAFNRLLGFDRSEPLTALIDAFETQYDPTKTLFVSEYRWVTAAKQGSDIEHIVFAQGISTIPAFTHRHFSKNSIQIHTVALPSSVQTIQTGAFSEVFNIEQLHIYDNDTVYVEESALKGVAQFNWIPTIYDRDAPEYEITDTIAGEPLIIVDAFDDTNNPNISVERVKAYYISQGIRIVSYTVRLNLSDMDQSRVYLYSDEGYLGYIIPTYHSNTP